MQFNIAKEFPDKGLEEFVMEFLTDRESEYEQLKTLGKKNDFEGMCSLAHKWKGFCQPYGFIGLGLLSKDLEEKSEQKDLDSCQQLISAIDDYLKMKRVEVTK